VSDTVTEAYVRRTLETVWRLESARVVGALTRLVRDVGLAEELTDWPGFRRPATLGDPRRHGRVRRGRRR
jgi:hypothetical protein